MIDLHDKLRASFRDLSRQLCDIANDYHGHKFSRARSINDALALTTAFRQKFMSHFVNDIAPGMTIDIKTDLHDLVDES